MRGTDADGLWIDRYEQLWGSEDPVHIRSSSVSVAELLTPVSRGCDTGTPLRAGQDGLTATRSARSKRKAEQDDCPAKRHRLSDTPAAVYTGNSPHSSALALRHVNRPDGLPTASSPFPPEFTSATVLPTAPSLRTASARPGTRTSAGPHGNVLYRRLFPSSSSRPVPFQPKTEKQIPPASSACIPERTGFWQTIQSRPASAVVPIRVSVEEALKEAGPGMSGGDVRVFVGGERYKGREFVCLDLGDLGAERRRTV
ncbi:hypothetical protein OE88DRAFT_529324 [Heliocybe sulcata]|uniref:Uncharacterized protein n=1 Tax=Heliocybe sulcata TaxID=5364 RepID=A0A5C3N3X0_9AGAM|nr:hypothetical protein OE88DRAFT_529324 [Heliocybe sulcata]